MVQYLLTHGHCTRGLMMWSSIVQLPYMVPRLRQMPKHVLHAEQMHHMRLGCTTVTYTILGADPDIAVLNDAA